MCKKEEKRRRCSAQTARSAKGNGQKRKSRVRGKRDGVRNVFPPPPLLPSCDKATGPFILEPPSPSVHPDELCMTAHPRYVRGGW